MGRRVVFLHGSGAPSGASAWPVQAAGAPVEWVFLDRAVEGDSPAGDAERVLQAIGRSASHVVAHSYGGIAALLAAQREPDKVRSLTLAEPACLDLARGERAVEGHIAAMGPVFDLRTDPTVSSQEFWRRFAEALGVEPPTLPVDVLEENVARLRATTPPWQTGLDTTTPLPVPTLVVTSGEAAMYEEVARACVARGAVHTHITGFGHRVQDAPSFNEMLTRHIERAEAP